MGRENIKRQEKNMMKILDRIIIFLSVTVFSVALFSITYFAFLRSDPEVVYQEVEKLVLSDNYLFLGDSITRAFDIDYHFEGLPVVNSGVDANTTSDVLGDLRIRAFNYNPSKVFLLIGTNDVAKRMDNSEIIENIKKIIDEFQEYRPHAEIYLISVLPVNENFRNIRSGTNEQIIELNRLIELLGVQRELNFIDLFEHLTNELGELHEDYTDDGLHITKKGYETIARRLQHYIV